jgi:hypothetical protein
MVHGCTSPGILELEFMVFSLSALHSFDFEIKTFGFEIYLILAIWFLQFGSWDWLPGPSDFGCGPGFSRQPQT